MPRPAKLPLETRRAVNLIASGAAKKDIDLNIGVLNGQLEGREFVLGHLSIVDFAIAPYLLGRHGQAIDYDRFPNARAWLDRCNQLDGIVATVFRPRKN